MRACNKRIACRPIEKRGLETQVTKGFATVKTKNELVKTQIVWSDDEGVFFEGETVYLRADCIKLSWAIDEFEVEGRKVIFVPVEAVVLANTFEA